MAQSLLRRGPQSFVDIPEDYEYQIGDAPRYLLPVTDDTPMMSVSADNPNLDELPTAGPMMSLAATPQEKPDATLVVDEETAAPVAVVANTDNSPNNPAVGVPREKLTSELYGLSAELPPVQFVSPMQAPRGISQNSLNNLNNAFSAFWDEDTPAGGYFRRLNKYGATADENALKREAIQVSRMNALAQLMNASRARANLGTFGKYVNDQVAAGIPRDEAIRNAQDYMTRSGGINLNFGDKQQQTRLLNIDKAWGDEIAKNQEELNTVGGFGTQAQLLLNDIEAGYLSGTGRFGSGAYYAAKKGIGATDEREEQALQRLDNLAGLMRVEYRPVAGTGVVSNVEQGYISVMVPGLDKTAEQNAYILNFRLREKQINEKAFDAYKQAYYSGKSKQDGEKEYTSILKQGYDALLKEYGIRNASGETNPDFKPPWGATTSGGQSAKGAPVGTVQTRMGKDGNPITARKTENGWEIIE